MTTVLAWRNLVEYARRPLNLILLAVVPVVFVSLSAGVIADFARILGGEAGVGQLEVTTAGWAAAFLAGVAAFFHVNGSRSADRRLASADGSSVRVVTVRLGSSLLLAAVATAGALLALALRTDIVDVPRAVGATGMFAIIYLGIGASVGALVRSEINGSLVIVLARHDRCASPTRGSRPECEISHWYHREHGYDAPAGSRGRKDSCPARRSRWVEQAGGHCARHPGGRCAKAP